MAACHALGDRDGCPELGQGDPPGRPYSSAVYVVRWLNLRQTGLGAAATWPVGLSRPVA